ncbi:hypothetical protein LSG31_00775 [Fodinisporobacter ferrooxydans]|uniref:Uncharacterized protein n=1 Tax=Fodinisporobacter ferrooxydans TaxID=2901836 RepID=A0ABY4CK04_9BACL|nr:hypothetical protein LSG31_00775 [Alicyclobacillaceae bacterium MYW30-H2]
MTNDDLQFKKVFLNYLKVINFKLFSMIEVFLALSVSAIVVILLNHTTNHAAASTQIFYLIFTASATILGIVVAGFAIYATVADKQFIVFLHKSNALSGLLFPFWLGSIIWAFLICTSLIFNLPGLNLTCKTLNILVFLFSFFFVLAIGYTISLVGSIFKAGMYRAEFELVTENKQENNTD